MRLVPASLSPLALALALGALAPAVQAACAGTTVIACPVETGDWLQVCVTETGFSYAYGSPDEPEMILSQDFADGPVTPWPGVSNSIWSTVTFPNGDYAYEAWISIQRDDAAEVPSGGVRILQGAQMIGERTCEGGEIAAAFTLEDAMEAAGQCWNLDSQTWGAC